MRDVLDAETVNALPEVNHGAHRALNALRARSVDVLTRDTDPRFARLVGSLLHAAGAGSDLLADAHAVAAAVEDGGGIVPTADPDDLGRLAAGHPRVVIAAL